MKWIFAPVLAVGSLFLAAERAEACGCLAPSVATPVVQVGERIVFERADGKVIAHIQIQYQGPAQDFAWLLPAPSEPVFRLGTEELFTLLDAQTRPTFQLTQTFNCGGGGGFGCGSDDSAIGAPNSFEEQPDVLVTKAALGPYDYAVLRADAKEPMLEWLRANNYFVPAGTDDTLRPYIRSGAYFLAVKLRSGQSTGDLQPVIVEYAAELPMIPIILTSVAAADDMGILVYVFGPSRAIPRNYAHVIVNDEHINWLADASNYSEVVKKAIDEADGGHAFVTEYSGRANLFTAKLDYPGRFGDYEQLARTSRVDFYVGALGDSTFPWGLAEPIFRRYFPYPDEARGIVSEEDYYADPQKYFVRFARDVTYDPVALTEELWTRIVRPAQESERMIQRNFQVTRLLTILSPHEMTEDPVFGFNPELPEVSNVRGATQVLACGDESTLHLPDGRQFDLDTDADWSDFVQGEAPFARRIEVLAEEGPPRVILGNNDLITESDAESGCSSSKRRPLQGAAGVLLLLSVCLIGRRLMMRVRE